MRESNAHAAVLGCSSAVQRQPPNWGCEALHTAVGYGKNRDVRQEHYRPLRRDRSALTSSSSMTPRDCSSRHPDQVSSRDSL